MSNLLRPLTVGHLREQLPAPSRYLFSESPFCLTALWASRVVGRQRSPILNNGVETLLPMDWDPGLSIVFKRAAVTFTPEPVLRLFR